MVYPKISIVTPNYNGAEYIEETIKSIVNQNYPNLEYIIIDGGSTDGSIEIIKKYEQHLSYWISEKDDGLYYALNKGFRQSTGEIMGWLNSDDMLHRYSLFSLAEIFRLDGVEWVQGPHSWFDHIGRTFMVRPVRLKSFYNYLMKEYYNVPSPFIQQESTYWKRSLWERSGGFISTSYKFAGDFDLWMRFFQAGQLFLTSSLVGGFRYTGIGQLSVDNYNDYLKEADIIIRNIKMTKQDKEKLKFLNSFSLVDKIPYFRRSRSRKRRKLLNESNNIVWNAVSRKFCIS